MKESCMKKIIVNADDFGACPEINQAVLMAHTQGILSSASLMLGAKHLEEAIQIAKENPSLKIGIHLTLSNAYSVLSAEKIPDLVDASGRFSSHLFLSGMRYFLSQKIKKQIQAEIEAQIERFIHFNLNCDHLNFHNHLQLHPSLLKITLEICKNFPQLKSFRIPNQNYLQNAWQKIPHFFLKALLKQMKKKLDEHHFFYNDELFGFFENGEMDEKKWFDFIPHIKEGVSEVYMHPATLAGIHFKAEMPYYKPKAELDALLSKQVKESLNKQNIQITTYTECIS